MKKMKKAFMGITALVMAFSMTAICACSEDKGSSDSGDNNTTQQHHITIPKTYADKVRLGFQTQTVKGMTSTVNAQGKMKTTKFASDKDGVKLKDAQETVKWEKAESQETTKTTASPLAFDSVSYSKTTAMDKNGTAVDKDAETEEYYDYAFLRSGKMFTGGAFTATETKDVVLTYDPMFAMPPQIEGMLSSTPDGVPASFLAPVSAIIGIAQDYEGLTEGENKLTINLNKVTYAAYNDVMTFVDGMDKDTTVGELIAAKPVKSLIQSLTYGVDTIMVHETVVATITAMMTPIGDNGLPEELTEAQAAYIAQITGAITAPEASDDVYDYLVKNLESKDFAGMVVSTITGESVGSMIAPFSEFKFADIMSLISKLPSKKPAPDTPSTGEQGGDGQQTEQGNEPTTEEEQPKKDVSTLAAEASGKAPTIEDIKKTVKDTITKYVGVTEDTITIHVNSVSVSLSNTELSFDVADDFTVTSVSVASDLTVHIESIMSKSNSSTSGSGTQTPATYECTVTDATLSLESTADFASDVTLADISANKVEIEKEVFEDGTYYGNNPVAYIGYFNPDEPDAKSDTEIYAGVVVKDGVVGDVKLYERKIGEEVWTEVANSSGLALNYVDKEQAIIENYYYSAEIDENNSRIYLSLEKIGSITTDENYKVNMQQEFGAIGEIYLPTEIVTETITVAEILAADEVPAEK